MIQLSESFCFESRYTGDFRTGPERAGGTPQSRIGAGAGMTLVALRTKVAQGLFCLRLGCWSSSHFFSTPPQRFLLPPPGGYLRLLPAKQSQYPRVLLWKERQHPLRVREGKKKKKGKEKRKKNRTSRIFFFKCYKTGRKTVPPLNISTYQISRC